MTGMGGKRFAVFAVLASGDGVVQSVSDAWLGVGTRDPQVRCFGGLNIGSMAGLNLFKETDAPKYEKGSLAVVFLHAASVLAILVTMEVHWCSNWRLVRQEHAGLAVDDDVVDAENVQRRMKNQI
jgi:hypothetical protein